MSGDNTGIIDPLDGKFKPAPAIIREETFYLDVDHNILGDYTDLI